MRLIIFESRAEHMYDRFAIFAVQYRSLKTGKYAEKKPLSIKF